jgi:predicted Co/Zn/Cd cation transporter (cation efflux family)
MYRKLYDLHNDEQTWKNEARDARLVYVSVAVTLFLSWSVFAAMGIVMGLPETVCLIVGGVFAVLSAAPFAGAGFMVSPQALYERRQGEIYRKV